ncbi:MAG: hypothetical protein M3280_10365 [Actinomycetota bacterium]|nr:hypothetical protein [Actinomycetota bacterium]
MESHVPRRYTSLWISGIILLIAFIAIARLPESLVAQMARNRPFFETGRQADWSYRLLVFAALAQAVYGGFVILQIDRVRRAMASDATIAGRSRARVLAVVARTAAGMVLFTLVYGLTALWFTGQRGGFWLFALIAAAQLAWYLRQVNVIASYLDFQPEPKIDDRPPARWSPAPDDYVPPIARALVSDRSSR